MDLLKGMNEVMGYIEEHLTEEIDTAKLAQFVGSSSYHFSRMFPFLTGVTLSEYIRRRRLTMAALELSQEGVRVIDVALKYGYESPTAFHGAFKNLHGVAPNQAKKMGSSLISYPKMSFHISIKGEEAMKYRIEEKEGLLLVGMVESIRKINGDEDFERISQIWAELSEEKMNQLMKLSNDQIEGLVGASVSQGENGFEYYVAVTTDEKAPSPLQSLEIKPQTWAIFESVGPLPKALVSLWQRIFTEWFPHSGYECVEAPCLEVYSAGDISETDYRCEIWVPVVKKK